MNLLSALVTNSIVGSVILITLLLFRPITNKIFSKSWHYYCLIVPLVFLLGGTHIATILANLTPTFTPTITSYSHALHEPAMDMNVEIIRPTTPSYLPNIPAQDNEITISIAPYITTQIAAHLEIVAPFLLVLWGLVATLFITTSTIKYLRYRRIVLHNANRVWGLNCPLPIYVSKYAHTPMLLGIFKPTIVLPDMAFTEKELDIILAHEIVHYKRKDLFIKLLMLIANALHWFNPAVYILSKQMDTACELSCDEEVVSEMDAQNRIFYGETILQVLKHSTAQKKSITNVAFATNLCNSKKTFKRRLTNMMNVKKMKKPVVALALTAGLLVTGSGAVLANTVGSALSVNYITETEQTNNITHEEALKMGAEAIYNAFGTTININDIELTYFAGHDAQTGRGNMVRDAAEWQDNILNNWQETLGMTVDEMLDYIRELSSRELTFEIDLAPYSLSTPVGLTPDEFMDIIINVYVQNRSLAVVEGWAEELGMSIDELYAYVWPPMPQRGELATPLDETALEYYATRLRNTANRLGVPADDFNFVLGKVWNVTLTTWEIPAQPSQWTGNVLENGAYFATYSFTINAETGEIMFLNYLPDAALMGRDAFLTLSPLED